MLPILVLVSTAFNTRTIHLKVDGVDRNAIVVATNQVAPGSPVLFMFHGHGGSAERCETRFQLNLAWPEAIIVYPDGLPISVGDPANNGQGWALECKASNRDIRFFDALYSKITHDYKPNPKKVF